MKLSMKLVALTLCITAMLATSACWLQSAWVAEAQAVVKLVPPAAIAVLDLVAAFRGAPVDQSAVASINADSSLVATLLQDYKDASAAAKPDLLSQLDAAALQTSKDLQTILGVIHVGDAATQTKISALVSFVIGEAEALASIIPAAQGKTAARARVAAAPPMQAKDFKKHFNAIMKAPTGNAALDAVSPQFALK